MSEVETRGRIAVDLVDGEGLYFSRLVTAGPYVFMSSLPVDSNGQLPAEARVPPPYELSPAAHVRAQTRFIYQRYVDLLPQVGCSIQDVVQIEQFMPAKKYGDGYTEESRSSGFLDRKRPTSANIATGDLLPSFATIAHTGIAVTPSGDFKKIIPPSTPGYVDSLTKPTHGDSFAEEGPFNEVITAGPYVFTVGDTAVDWATRDISAEAKVDDLVWWGSEIRSETDFVLKRFRSYLERVGASVDDVVHMTVYLTDIGDLYELDRSWRRVFKVAPPARSILPCRGLGIPAFEGTDLHHRHRGVRMEQLAQSIRPGVGYAKEVVSTGQEMLGHASQAIKAGPLLWTSEILAYDENYGRIGDTRAQLIQIFEKLKNICEAGKTSLESLVRLRAFVTNPDDGLLIFEFLKKYTAGSPPTVAVSAVPGPLHIPGCDVLVDAVAFVP